MLENDDIYLRVEECGDGEGRSFAGLQGRKRGFAEARWRHTHTEAGAGAGAYLNGELLPGTQALWQDDAEALLPAELQRVGALAGQELKRHDAHPHQLGLVELLEAFGDDRSHALQAHRNALLPKQKTAKKKTPKRVFVVVVVYQQIGPFGNPVPGIPRAVLLSCQDNQGNAISLVAVRCFKDIQLEG